MRLESRRELGEGLLKACGARGTSGCGDAALRGGPASSSATSAAAATELMAAFWWRQQKSSSSREPAEEPRMGPFVKDWQLAGWHHPTLTSSPATQRVEATAAPHVSAATTRLSPSISKKGGCDHDEAAKRFCASDESSHPPGSGSLMYCCAPRHRCATATRFQLGCVL